MNANSGSYSVRVWGEVYTVAADWADAASDVLRDGIPSGHQVAEYRHSPVEAMRAYLAQIASDSGDDDTHTDVVADIEDAIIAME